MKTALLLLLFLSSNPILKAQERKKDTLYFNIDKYYTISHTIIPNLSKQTYSERLEFNKQQMNHTKTNGYVFFVGDDFLIKGLKPKKILSIKDYIENRKFYFDGKYNQIIDKWKLKDSLTNKYTLFFVNGQEFIKPKHLEYFSYYPIRDGENVITNKIKDTLFFKLDNKYVYESKYEPKSFLIKDSNGSEIFFFKSIENVKNVKPTEILSLKKIIRSAKFYHKNKKQKLNNYELSVFFDAYVVFLVEKTKNKTEYVHVIPSSEIYD